MNILYFQFLLEYVKRECTANLPYRSHAAQSRSEIESEQSKQLYDCECYDTDRDAAISDWREGIESRGFIF